MLISRALALPLVLSLAHVTSGCAALEPPPPPPPQQLKLQVVGEPGEPIADVPFLLDNKEIGRTNGEGVASFAVDGEDGRPFTLSVACPSGTVSSSRALELVLRRMDRAPTYDFHCVSTERSIVVAIRTEGATDVPVKYLGREIARTDAEGYALVHLVPKASEVVHLTLDTSSDPKHAMLRPIDPQVAVGANDDGAFTINQKFVTERRAVRAAPKPHVPVAVFEKR